MMTLQPYDENSFLQKAHFTLGWSYSIRLQYSAILGDNAQGPCETFDTDMEIRSEHENSVKEG